MKNSAETWLGVRFVHYPAESGIRWVDAGSSIGEKRLHLYPEYKTRDGRSMWTISTDSGDVCSVMVLDIVSITLKGD